MIQKYFYPVARENEVILKAKKPAFNLDNQTYKSIIYIMLLESGLNERSIKGQLIKLPKSIFNNSIFRNTEFNILYKNQPKIHIAAKNLRIGIRLAKPLSLKNFTNVKTRFVGTKYSGMDSFSSYLGNTVGVPILKDRKILTPDINLEKEIFSYFIKRNKNPYNLDIKNIGELITKYNCTVWYKGNSMNPTTYYKYFEIKKYIDPYYKKDFENIMKIYSRNKNEKYIMLDNLIIKTEEVKRYSAEILNIILGKDMEDFKKAQQKSRSISKTEVLPNFKNKIKGLLGEPFEHQKYGISWLYNLYKAKISGAILADEMGLGKTFQSIGFGTILLNENKLRKKGDFLIVCPASVISVWEKELDAFSPRLKALSEIYSFEKFQRISNENKNPTVLVIDEAQRAKNRNTANNKRLQTVKAKFTLLLSGTPIENKTQDLYNILALVDPVFFKIFNILKRLSADEKDLASKTAGIINGIYLRRVKTKKQLSSILNIEEIYIPMNAQEAKVNQEVLNFYGNKKIKLNAKNTLEYYNDYIIALMRLRQVSSYVKQLQKEPYVKEELQEKASKMVRLHKLIKELPNDEKFVIFTSFTETTKFIKKELSAYGKVLVIDGAVSSTKRGDIIKEFQENPDTRFIIVSIKAGNAGITLHAARNVVMYDLWWNPAVMQQAIARVHRIGQLQNVKAYLFINEKGIDENILRIINLKKDITDAFEGKNNKFKSDKNVVDTLIKNIFE